jgi:hypothetical protein
MTSISIILMIPTLIASLYGMNVPNALENNRLWHLDCNCRFYYAFVLWSIFSKKRKNGFEKHCLNNFIFSSSFSWIIHFKHVTLYKVLLL